MKISGFANCLRIFSAFGAETTNLTRSKSVTLRLIVKNVTNTMIISKKRAGLRNFSNDLIVT